MGSILSFCVVVSHGMYLENDRWFPEVYSRTNIKWFNHFLEILALLYFGACSAAVYKQQMLRYSAVTQGAGLLCSKWHFQMVDWMQSSKLLMEWLRIWCEACMGSPNSTQNYILTQCFIHSSNLDLMLGFSIKFVDVIFYH